LSGTYNGIHLYRKLGDSWQFVKTLPPVQGACSQVIRGRTGDLWVNIPKFGVINAKLEEDYTISEQTIFPQSDFGDVPLQLSRQNDTILVLTDDHRFKFQASTATFAQETAKPTSPRAKHVLSGILDPVPLTDEYQFYPIHNGFALLRSGAEKHETKQSALLIRSARAFGADSSHQLLPDGEVAFRQNNVSIRYIVPQREGVRYQYQLAGHSATWSDWTGLTEATFMGLDAGEYTVTVRAATDQFDHPEKSFSFSVASPWYQRWWAYCLYAALFGGLLYLNRLWRKTALRRQKEQLLAREERERQERAWLEGQQNLKLRYATLEDALEEAKKQLRSKTIALAKKAKESEEKGKLLRDLREQIAALEEEATSNKFRWSQLSRMLETHPAGKDNSFDLQMEELNKDFLGQLSRKYPELTTYDLRLAAYLRNGLSTREIATHLDVLSSSVNVSRSRLRKKLGLDSKVDLYKFLNSLEEGK
ncbi:MAG: LuxR C-terminal-related transcriptional regulator, partial [Bacteroidota bacterium]